MGEKKGRIKVVLDTNVLKSDGEDNDDGLYIGVAGRENLLEGAGWKLLRLKSLTYLLKDYGINVRF